MATTASSCSPDVLWSGDRNAATKALAGTGVGYCDTFINLLCRHINETASRFGDACSELIRLLRNAKLFRITFVSDRSHRRANSWHARIFDWTHRWLYLHFLEKNK